MYGLRAKQQLSQNFIMDLNVTGILHSYGSYHEGKIVSKTEIFGKQPLAQKTVIEIGPGPGSLTRSILNAGCKNLILIEKDKRFMQSMHMLKDAVKDKGVNVSIHLADVLDVDEEELLRKVGCTKQVPRRNEANVIFLRRTGKIHRTFV